MPKDGRFSDRSIIKHFSTNFVRTMTTINIGCIYLFIYLFIYLYSTISLHDTLSKEKSSLN